MFQLFWVCDFWGETQAKPSIMQRIKSGKFKSSTKIEAPTPSTGVAIAWVGIVHVGIRGPGYRGFWIPGVWNNANLIQIHRK